MLIELQEAIGEFPTVEIPYQGGVVDIRDFVIGGISIDRSIEFQLASDSLHLSIKFKNAQIIENHGTQPNAVIGTWLLSISRVDCFDLNTGADTLAFSLDFAVVQGWILSCTSAYAIITPRLASADVPPASTDL